MVNSDRYSKFRIANLCAMTSILCGANACTWEYLYPDMADLNDVIPADFSQPDLSFGVDRPDLSMHPCLEVAAIHLQPITKTPINQSYHCVVTVSDNCATKAPCASLLSYGDPDSTALCVVPIDYRPEIKKIPGFDPPPENGYWRVDYGYNFMSSAYKPRARVSILLIGPNSEILNETTQNNDEITKNKTVASIKIDSKIPIGFIRIILSSASESNYDYNHTPQLGLLELSSLTLQYKCN